jgi:hypothetical protein
VEDVRQTLNVRRAANGSTAHTTNAGVSVVHDCGLGEGFDLGGNVGNRISYSNLVGLLGAGLELGLNLLRLLRTTSGKRCNKGTDAASLSNLCSKISTECCISSSASITLQHLGREGVIGFVIRLQVVNDFNRENGLCVLHMLLFCCFIQSLFLIVYILWIVFNERSRIIFGTLQWR